MSSSQYLISNGVIFRSSEAPTLANILRSHAGAYTTTRTISGDLFLWNRHLNRLSDSLKFLSQSHPNLLFNSPSDSSPLFSFSEPAIRRLVDESARKILPVAAAESEDERIAGDELSLTALVAGNSRNGSDFDVHVHVGVYKPLVFGVRENGANLALVGRRREAAEAKYSDWTRVRLKLEKLRPPCATELLLSDNGDRILEGCVTNFFVVCRKDKAEGNENNKCFEVQTAPVRDGVLPGIIRQLVIEVCLSQDIPFREVAPSWSENEIWEEAFITNSLRIIQHVETISVPDEWDSLDSKSWNDISWNTKKFEECPGIITRTIQRAVMEKAALEGCQFGNDL